VFGATPAFVDQQIEPAKGLPVKCLALAIADAMARPLGKSLAGSICWSTTPRCANTRADILEATEESFGPADRHQRQGTVLSQPAGGTLMIEQVKGRKEPLLRAPRIPGFP